MKEKIKRWYDLGLWTDAMVDQAVAKGVLTKREAKAILSGGVKDVSSTGDQAAAD